MCIPQKVTRITCDVRQPRTLHRARRAATLNELVRQVRQVERGRAVTRAVGRSNSRKQCRVGGTGYSSAVTEKATGWVIVRGKGKDGSYGE